MILMQINSVPFFQDMTAASMELISRLTPKVEMDSPGSDSEKVQSDVRFLFILFSFLISP